MPRSGLGPPADPETVIGLVGHNYPTPNLKALPYPHVVKQFQRKRKGRKEKKINIKLKTVVSTFSGGFKSLRGSHQP